MRTRHPVTSIEALESRIAPALLFIGTASLDVSNGSSVHQPTADEADAAAGAHSTAAVLLHAGDTLVFDADNSHTLTPGDTKMVAVTTGGAMVFLTDSNTSGGYDLSELTGVAFGGKFKGAIGTTVSGSVVNALSDFGQLTFNSNNLVVQHGQVVGLTVTGQIQGSLLVGGNLSATTISDPLGVKLGTNSVLDSVAVGTASDGVEISLNGGADQLTTSFNQNSGEAGASIQGLTLAHGAASVKAGDGNGYFSLPAGSISNLTMSDLIGSTTIQSGANFADLGGDGGNISKVSITTEGSGSIRLITGDGANSHSTTAAHGGHGGSISVVKIRGDLGTGDLEFSTGNGRNGYKAGGHGGNISGVDVLVSHAGDVSLETGVGADGTGANGIGGAGGTMSGVTVIVTEGAASGLLQTGKGGGTNTKMAGAGGSISSTTLQLATTGAVSVTTGNGGDLYAGTGVNFHAGDGGAIKGLTVALTGTAAAQKVTITTGDGGDLDAGAGTGGNSGAISGLTVKSSVALSQSSAISTGTGGQVYAPDPITGSTSLHVGNAGNTASLSGVKITDTSSAVNSYEIYAGVPIINNAGGGKGGPGGSTAYGTMDGAGPGAHGGNIGSISTVTLDAPLAKFTIGKSDAAGASISIDGRAGDGGNISGIKGSVGTIDILAPSGGVGVANGNNDNAGTGGNGGSISDVKLSHVTNFVHLIAAGDGGVGSYGGHGGKAGNISSIKVAGDIGDFTKAFDLVSATGQGGLVAGRSGNGDPFSNGSITNVDVGTHGIATIIAGRTPANQLTYFQAVSKLAGIKAAKIGADTGIAGTNSESSPAGANATFDWNEGSQSDTTFTPDSDGHVVDGDVPIDGFAFVVKGKGGATLPVKPLKLVEVSLSTFQ